MILTSFKMAFSLPFRPFRPNDDGPALNLNGGPGPVALHLRTAKILRRVALHRGGLGPAVLKG